MPKNGSKQTASFTSIHLSTTTRIGFDPAGPIAPPERAKRVKICRVLVRFDFLTIRGGSAAAERIIEKSECGADCALEEGDWRGMSKIKGLRRQRTWERLT